MINMYISKAQHDLFIIYGTDCSATVPYHMFLAECTVGSDSLKNYPRWIYDMVMVAVVLLDGTVWTPYWKMMGVVDSPPHDLIFWVHQDADLVG